jgi:NAD(P)-dependent dehydrogenase (short-subunit alcohol dehydrogenase family)
MNPRPDHGEADYKGSGRLEGLKAVITGADSGIGRAVALAYAREGADVLISYLDSHDDAAETRRLVEEAGRRAVLVAGDIAEPGHCRAIVDEAVEAFGRIDILVNNAAHQASFKAIEDIPDQEWERTFAVNIHAMFYLTKAAVPHMPAGGAIINTSSINADTPGPELLAYATTKGAIQNFTAGLAQLLAERGLRANCVAPGPIWTPLIPSTLPMEKVRHFGEQVPMKRPGQPKELAHCVCHARRTFGVLRIGRDRGGDRRQADPLISGEGQGIHRGDHLADRDVMQHVTLSGQQAQLRPRRRPG